MMRYKIIYLLLVTYMFQSCTLYKSNNIMKYRFDFYTQYRSFYLTSDNTEEASKPEVLAISNDEDNGRLIAVKNTLIVTTGSYGHIRGEVKLLHKRNELVDFDKYEHIVEAGVAVQSGKLQILDCPLSHIQFEINITPGLYGVRVYSSGLSTSNFDEEEGNDRYLIEIWPDNTVKREVLKKYPGY